MRASLLTSNSESNLKDVEAKKWRLRCFAFMAQQAMLISIQAVFVNYIANNSWSSNVTAQAEENDCTINWQPSSNWQWNAFCNEQISNAMGVVIIIPATVAIFASLCHLCISKEPPYLSSPLPNETSYYKNCKNFMWEHFGLSLMLAAQIPGLALGITQLILIARNFNYLQNNGAADANSPVNGIYQNEVPMQLLSALSLFVTVVSIGLLIHKIYKDHRAVNAPASLAINSASIHAVQTSYNALDDAKADVTPLQQSRSAFEVASGDATSDTQSHAVSFVSNT